MLIFTDLLIYAWLQQFLLLHLKLQTFVVHCKLCYVQNVLYAYCCDIEVSVMSLLLVVVRYMFL